MRLLVTRPEPDALTLKARLEELGHEATVAPMLTVSFENADPIDLSEVHAVIATSRNGLKALKAQGAHRIAASLPIYVVGHATAREAQSLGFTEIIVGGGTVSSLIPEIVGSADPHTDVLLHLAGDEVAGELVRELELHGFRVMQPIVYRMVPTTAFTPDVEEQIETGEVEGVLLFSPRTAAIYTDLIVQHGLIKASQRLNHYCLSRAVAQRLAPIAPVRIELAETPTLDAMLSLLE
jgi:uroporphyrinogen-III synthase